MIWAIVMKCVAAAIVCGPHVEPQIVALFNSQRECETAIIQVARRFDPGNGAFTFNCEGRV